ncbi:MAG: hypothetical protein HN590_15780, partial [Calditrichaeota bacterium]|nr:hypothetical protein [Calditrichota bacterium]
MINLKRKVKVSSYDFEATILVAQERPEFLAVAALADELVTITGKDVIEYLLGGLSERVGRKVIDRAVSMGLLIREENGSPAGISEIGKIALEKGQVMCREEGIFRFFVLKDPLLKNSLIHIKRINTDSAKDDRIKLKNRDSNDKAIASFSGKMLEQLINHDSSHSPIPRESISDGELFSIESIASTGEEKQEYESSISIGLNFEQEYSIHIGALSPTHQNDVERIAILHPPNKSDLLNEQRYEDVWKELVGQSDEIDDEDALQSDNLIVPISFSVNLPPDALKQFIMDATISEPKVSDLGSFQSTT